MSHFNIVLESEKSTVITEYTPQQKRSDAYHKEKYVKSVAISSMMGPAVHVDPAIVI